MSKLGTAPIRVRIGWKVTGTLERFGAPLFCFVVVAAMAAVMYFGSSRTAHKAAPAAVIQAPKASQAAPSSKADEVGELEDPAFKSPPQEADAAGIPRS